MTKREERFKAVAERRTNKIIEMISTFDSFYGRRGINYSYSKQQVDMIFGAIESELREQKSKMLENLKNGGDCKSFTLGK
ncbi:MAG: hypothetical protein IJI83_02950 [Oscillospiraceae bacterium]|nr:hypothetical protein [Oscillospiraceae bacterium]